MKSLTDKLAVVWKGPSWFPGGPRLGLDEYKINVTSRTKYETYLPAWRNLYIIMHFCIVFYNHLQLCDDTQDIKNFAFGFTIMNNLFALTTIGLLFDKSVYAGAVEFMRCLIYLSLSTVHDRINVYIYSMHVVSFCIWSLYIFQKVKSNLRFANN